MMPRRSEGAKGRREMMNAVGDLGWRTGNEPRWSGECQMDDLIPWSEKEDKGMRRVIVTMDKTKKKKDDNEWLNGWMVMSDTRTRKKEKGK